MAIRAELQGHEFVYRGNLARAIDNIMHVDPDTHIFGMTMPQARMVATLVMDMIKAQLPLSVWDRQGLARLTADMQFCNCVSWSDDRDFPILWG